METTRPDPAPPADRGGRITTLGVPTRGRVESLRRCLGGYLDCCRRHDRPLAVAVADDSPDPDTRRACREALRSLPAVRGVERWYAGPEERQRFAAALARQSGAAAEVVEFALGNPEGCPLTTGAARNALLLHAAGELLLQADDDTLCRAAPAPGAAAGVAVASGHDPTEFWFFAEGEPPPTGEPGDVDLFAAHESLLGKRVADVVAAAGPDAGQAAVAVTTAGVLGDSGMGSPVYLLTLRGESRARLVRSEAAYRRAVAGRGVVRAVTRPTVGELASCMALNLGLDNRGLLPPFLPVQRNQDGVFAGLLRAADAAAWRGWLPWAVVHDSPGPRPAAADPWADAAAIRTGQAVQILVRLAAPRVPAGDAAGRLQGLGAALQEFAALPPAEFERLLHDEWRRQLAGLGAQLADALRRHDGRPDFRAADVRRLLTEWRDRLADPVTAVPADLAGPFRREPARALTRRLVGRFGRLVAAWPDLVAAARDLRARGVRPAVPA